MDIPTDRTTDQSPPVSHSRWGWKRWVVVIVVVLIAVGVFYIWLVNRSEQPNDTVAPVPTTQFSETQDRLMRDRVIEAEQKAQTDWKNDATLMVISLPFTNLEISADSPPITYFYSAKDTENDYYCELRADLSGLGNCGVEAKLAETPVELLQPITSDDWTKSLKDIVNEVEIQGGKYYRIQHPDAQFFLELTKTEESGSKWRAYYNSTSADTPEVVPVSAKLVVTNTNSNQ